MNKLTLLDRLKAETPGFWKVVGIVGFSLVLLLALAGSFYPIPAKITTVVNTIGYTLTVIAPFAVKDSQILTNATSLPSAIVDMVAALPGQIADVKAAITSPPPVPGLLDALSNLTSAINQPPQIATLAAVEPAQPTPVIPLAAAQAPAVAPGPVPVYVAPLPQTQLPNA